MRGLYFVTRGEMAERSEPFHPLANTCCSVCWTSFSINDAQIVLRTVANLENLVDAQALLRDGEAAEPPYWAHVWSGSRAIARRLAAYGVAPGQRLLDVGCGLGLVALAAARLGARAYAFDRERHAVHFTRASALANHLPVTLWCADLARPAIRASFHWICAADMTYDPTLQDQLLHLAAHHLLPGGKLLCAESVRVYDTSWLDRASQQGWRARSEVVADEEEGRTVWVRLTQLQQC